MMTKKWYICITLLFTFQVGIAQLTVSDKKELSKTILKKINTLRKRTGHSGLILQADLQKAAQLHAGYMQKNKKLSHSQRTASLNSPKKRIQKYSKEFNVFGENILYTKPKRLPLKKAIIRRIANEMFMAWKNSPGHYANMISDDYTQCDFGFKYDKKSRRIYAANVFGGIGVLIDGQLSSNGFEIKTEEENEAVDCFDLMNHKKNIAVNIGNAISIEGNSVFLYYHDKRVVEELIEAETDGIAVDILQRDQFECKTKNQLDVSEIYDGVLLKPVYKKELFSNNTAKGEHRLITKIGEIPAHLVGKDIQISMILIKNGVKCDYNYPITISRKDYDLLPFPPNLKKAEIDFIEEGIVGMQDAYFQFNRDEINTKIVPSLYTTNGIHSIDIMSYSSVEGNKKSNTILHKERALFIKNFLLSKIDNKEIKINSKAKENWALCNFQLEQFGLDSLMETNKETIRKYINKNTNKEWREALKKQRVSKARIFYIGKLTSSDELFLEMNILTGIKNKNYKLVNRALYELYQKDKKIGFFKNGEWLQEFLIQPELVENTSAILLKDINEYDTEMIVLYVRNWLKKAEELSKEAIENILNLYAITTDKMLSYWDIESEKIARIMHPDKTALLLERYDDANETHPLLLNFHIATINYYSHTRDRAKLIGAFNFITQYYRNKILTIKDKVKLALFFNRWSSYTLSYELLIGDLKKETISKEGAFILAQNAIVTNADKKIVQLLMNKAYTFDPKKWCSWIKEDFQLLRNKNVKSIYCKKCID
jgi:uncharacterized protein YkwD